MDLGFTTAAYVVAAILFILSLGGLSGQESAKRAVWYGIVGMALAVFATLIGPGSGLWFFSIILIAGGGVIGYMLASRVEMTQMPELVAGMHALVGLAAVFVGFIADFEMGNVAIAKEAGTANELTGFAALIAKKSAIELSILRVELFLGVFIGAITFTGSVIAYGKLSGKVTSAATKLPGGHALNAGAAIISALCLIWYLQSGSLLPVVIMTLMAFFIGFHLIMGIGGADMPVVVSMLNSYSGWAAAAIGFSLGNDLLIVVGALVGSSGAILSYIMCKAMNRSFVSVILGGFGEDSTSTAVTQTDKTVKSGGSTDGSFIMKNSEHVIIVPGYGMAVSQAQHIVKEMADLLKKNGVKVSFAIHPVAGSMPGHMNVLLAEANVSYDEVFELEEINSDFSTCDVAFVIGANDITNPAAKTDPSSPIAGMPILDVENAKTVLFVKRSLSPGYAGIDNKVFYNENTLMLFGDAKKIVEEIVKELD